LPDDDGGSSITGLIIFRSEDGEDFQVLEEIEFVLDAGVDAGENDFYNDTSVINGIRYFYYIIVQNVAGKSPPSTIVDSMAKGVPQHPSNISVVADENDIFINWTHPGNNGGSAVLKYMIYRSMNGDEFELVNILSGDQNSWIDDDLEDGEYVYRISAVNEYGESDPIESSSVEIDNSGQGNNLLKIMLIIFVLITILVISIIAFFIFMKKMRSSGDDEKNHTIEEGDINNRYPNHGEDSILSVNE
ncbi:MAG: fibronectin type III domain-containing protein, partial [Thermoplasmatota archaeon]